MSNTQFAIDAVRRLEVLENENVALQAMLEKCNSKFIVGLEAENAALREKFATIRAATVEECAKVCESRGTPGTGSVEILAGAADAIRALLKDKNHD